MNNDAEIRKNVREKYGQIARGEMKSECLPNPASSCCGTTSGNIVVNVSSRYRGEDIAGLPPGADLGLGCGTPTAFSDLKEGMTVLDLGSGAGIDCFIASKHVGKTGRVIGVDMTDAMIRKAEENKAAIGADNVEFRLGEIESLPVDGHSVDYVISNCVINLLPEKEKAFREIFRVLVPGGRFTVSDIVVDGEITEEERKDASLWAGCISGALRRDEYLGIINNAGFTDVRIVTEKKYPYSLKNAEAGLFSITVSGKKS